MFYVWDIDGSQRLLSSKGESVTSRRSVEPVQGPQSPNKVKQNYGRHSDEHVSNKAGKVAKLYKEARENKQPELVLKASQIMSEPVFTLSPETKLKDALETIKEHRFRHVPVVDDNQQILGIVSDRDLLRHFVDNKEDGASKISSIMNKEVITANPETDIRKIAKTMFENRIGSMPITDEEGSVVGILTRSDILHTVTTYSKFSLWI